MVAAVVLEERNCTVKEGLLLVVVVRGGRRKM